MSNGHAFSKATSSEIVPDDYIIEKCRGAKNAAKFADLYDAGDVNTYHNGDDSVADLALLRILAYWTQDEAQLERLFSASALGRRAKWMSRADYRRRTIQRALSNLGEPYDWTHKGEARKVSSSQDTPAQGDDDYTNSEPEIVWFHSLGGPKPRKFIIEKVARKGYPLLVYGAGGVAKSFAVLAAGIAIASEDDLNDWMGLNVLEHGHVLYVDFELDVEEQHKRVVELCNGLGVDVPKRLAYLSGRGYPRDTTFAKAQKFAKDKPTVAVIIDSVGQAMVGDMDRNRDVNAFYRDYIESFTPLGVTPILVDHEGKLQSGEKHKDKSPIGGVFKSNNARGVLQFILDEYDKETSTLDIRVRTHKINFEPPEPFGISIKFEADKVSLTSRVLPTTELIDDEREPLEKRLLAALEVEPTTAADLRTLTGATEGAIRNKLSELMRRKPPAVVGNDSRPKVYSLVSSSSPPYAGVSDDDDTNSERMTPGQRIVSMLSAPPEWLATQLKLCREDPGRYFGPTCAAISGEVFEDSHRSEEVAPVLQAHLDQERLC